jgi:hypothetical protein
MDTPARQRRPQLPSFCWAGAHRAPACGLGAHGVCWARDRPSRVGPCATASVASPHSFPALTVDMITPPAPTATPCRASTNEICMRVTSCEKRAPQSPTRARADHLIPCRQRHTASARTAAATSPHVAKGTGRANGSPGLARCAFGSRCGRGSPASRGSLAARAPTHPQAPARRAGRAPIPGTGTHGVEILCRARVASGPCPTGVLRICKRPALTHGVDPCESNHGRKGQRLGFLARAAVQNELGARTCRCCWARPQI